MGGHGGLAARAVGGRDGVREGDSSGVENDSLSTGMRGTGFDQRHDLETFSKTFITQIIQPLYIIFFWGRRQNSLLHRVKVPNCTDLAGEAGGGMPREKYCG